MDRVQSGASVDDMLAGFWRLDPNSKEGEAREGNAPKLERIGSEIAFQEFLKQSIENGSVEDLQKLKGFNGSIGDLAKLGNGSFADISKVAGNGSWADLTKAFSSHSGGDLAKLLAEPAPGPGDVTAAGADQASAAAAAAAVAAAGNGVPGGHGGMPSAWPPMGGPPVGMSGGAGGPPLGGNGAHVYGSIARDESHISDVLRSRLAGALAAANARVGTQGGIDDMRQMQGGLGGPLGGYAPPPGGLLPSVAGGMVGSAGIQGGMMGIPGVLPPHHMVRNGAAGVGAKGGAGAGAKQRGPSKAKTKGSEGLAKAGASDPASGKDDDDHSGSGDGEDDENGGGKDEQKRLRRMLSNRESARRSRRRKQAHLTELEQQVENLQAENQELVRRVAEIGRQYAQAIEENKVLKTDLEQLRWRANFGDVSQMAAARAPGLAGANLPVPMRNGPGTVQPAMKPKDPVARDNVDLSEQADVVGQMASPEGLRRIGITDRSGKMGRSASLQRIASEERLHKKTCQ